MKNQYKYSLKLALLLLLSSISVISLASGKSFIPNGAKQEMYFSSLTFSGPNLLDSLGRKTGVWVYNERGFKIVTYEAGKKNGISISSGGTMSTQNVRKLLYSVATYHNDSIKSYMDLPKPCSPLAAQIVNIKKNSDFKREAELIGYPNLDSVLQFNSYEYNINNEFQLIGSVNGLFYKGADWEIDFMEVGPQVTYNINGIQEVRIPELQQYFSTGDPPESCISQIADTVFYKSPSSFVSDQFPLIFHGPNQRDFFGRKIGQWVEVARDNSLEISFYDNGKKFGYRQTYIDAPELKPKYLAILTEMKDNHVNGNALAFDPNSGMPYIIAKETGLNTDFKEEANLLIGNDKSPETIQSYISIYENDNLLYEGWMICREQDFLKRKCYFVGTLKEYSPDGNVTMISAPIDGTPIEQINLPSLLDRGFAM